MCYDDQVISAYVDGELELRLHTEVENHISECERCRKLANEYKALQDLFSATSGAPADAGHAGVDSLEQKARVWKEIQRHTRRERVQDFWHRRLQVPMPVAAGLAAALAILVLTLLINPFGTEQQMVPVAMQSEETLESIPEVPSDFVSPANTMPEIEQLVRFLSDQGAAIEVKIQLPSSSKIQVTGEPQLLRAADYRRSEGE